MADTLMEHLPPAGWSDLARRGDIDNLRLEMRAMGSRLDAKLERKINAQTRWFRGSQLALVAATITSITVLAH